jgi:iron(III) transport system permease protein
MADVTVRSGRTSWWRHFDLWSVVAVLIAAAVLLPIFAIGWLALFPAENIWPHLLSTTLPRYLFNSLLLMASVGVIAGVIGTTTAWLVVMKQFPLRRVVEWALLLPLAIPAYIGAYALVDFWEYAGPMQSALREVFGWSSARDYWFPEIRSRGAAILVISFSLYPYVYLLARAAFREQSSGVLEVSRALGCGPWSSFWRVGLPLARPAIAAGMAIVMMETLNDFGTVEFFAVQTLTTGIFSVWLEGSNAGGAAQIAMVILVLVLVLVSVEKISRRNIRFHATSKHQRPLVPERLGRSTGLFATLLCAMPILIGFIMPVAIIAHHALQNPRLWADPELWSAAITTAWAAGTAAVLTVSAGILLVYGVRLSRRAAPRLLVPVTTIGYAAPGAVLGLGILIPFAAMDNWVADTWLAFTGTDPGLLFTGTAAAVIFAYFVRFFAIAQGTVDAAFGRLSPSMGMAARSLGHSAGSTLRLIHLPLVRGSLLTAALLIFVDASKELPATLLLRPFGFNTLATHVYDRASLENLAGAAPAALVVILTSMIAVGIVAHSTNKR